MSGIRTRNTIEISGINKLIDVHNKVQNYIYIFTPTKVKHHLIFLSIYCFTSILLKQ